MTSPEEFSIDEQYSLVYIYILHFVSAVSPKEILRNKEVEKSELFSFGVPSPEAVDELHN